MHLEAEGMLDPLYEVHLYCLHFIFLPRINDTLTQWMRAWNMHRMHSEHGQSPLQLWTSGLQAHFGSTTALSVPPSFFENDVSIWPQKPTLCDKNLMNHSRSLMTLVWIGVLLLVTVKVRTTSLFPKAQLTLACILF